MSYYAITGRIWGDDEDTVLTLYADSKEEAINQFRHWMWEQDGSSQEDRDLLEANGEGVFINQILVSTSPIAVL